jgi:hypothetical protein
MGDADDDLPSPLWMLSDHFIIEHWTVKMSTWSALIASGVQMLHQGQQKLCAELVIDLCSAT